MIHQIRDTFLGIHLDLVVEMDARVGVITPSAVINILYKDITTEGVIKNTYTTVRTTVFIRVILNG